MFFGMGKFTRIKYKKFTFFGIGMNVQWEQGIVLFLGRYSRHIGPGLFFTIPLLEEAYVTTMRTIPIDIPKQEIITKDNVSVHINGVTYIKVKEPKSVIMNVREPRHAVLTYTQTALRDVIGTMTLDQVLSERLEIAKRIEKIVDKMAHEWGIDIESIKLKDIVLPESMKRAMARQAEAEREKRGLIIKSQGELEASKNFVPAAKNISNTPGAMYLRTLSTLADITSDKASKKKIYIIPPSLIEAIKKIAGTNK